MRPEPIWVVAGALRATEGTTKAGGEERWLMHRRPQEKAHGGLWEFPGGKIEAAEIPVEALIRELHEELGIVVESGACEPAGFAEDRREPSQQLGQQLGSQAGRRPIVILLYTIADWIGEPQSLEGGAVAWFSREEIAKLAKPPLDEQLTAQLFGR